MGIFVLICYCRITCQLSCRIVYIFLICTNSFSKPAGCWLRLYLNLWISLGSTVILIMLRLPVHKHRMFFHLFGSSFLATVSSSFQNISLALIFFNLLLSHFFDAFVNGIVFLISFPISLFHFKCIEIQWISVYWHCILQPCWAHLLVLLAC